MQKKECPRIDGLFSFLELFSKTRIDRRLTVILFFALREHKTTPHSLSYVLARFHVDPCSFEASARSQRGGMRCCVRRVPISENFPIRFPISEIRNRKLLWAFRVFGNQTVIFELIRHTLNLSLQLSNDGNTHHVRSIRKNQKRKMKITLGRQRRVPVGLTPRR